MSKIHNIEANDLDSLAGEITRRSDDSPFLEPGSSNQIVAVQRKDMMDFLDTSLPGDTDELREVINNYFDLVQTQIKAVLVYNSKMQEYLQSELNLMEQEQVKALAKPPPNAEQFNTDLPQMLSLLSSAYIRQFNRVLKQLYEGSHAYSCLTLKPSGAMRDVLGHLQGFSQVD